MKMKRVAYRFYPLKKVMVVNGWEFNEVVVSSHYEKNHPYMTDEKILEIMKQLDKRDDFIPHRQGKLPKGIEWQSFFWEPFFHEDKAYRLVWYWEIGNPKFWLFTATVAINMKSKRSIKNNNNNFPHLPEEEINKLVEELSDPNLLPLSQKTEDAEEELLLIKVLKRKLKEGTIKVEMTNDGKLWLKTSKPILGGITQVSYEKTPYLEKKLKLN